jgi:hypothetical protein
MHGPSFACLSMGIIMQTDRVRVGILSVVQGCDAAQQFIQLLQASCVEYSVFIST